MTTGSVSYSENVSKECHHFTCAYATVTVIALALLVFGILARAQVSGFKNMSQLSSTCLMSSGSALIITEVIVLAIRCLQEPETTSTTDPEGTSEEVVLTAEDQAARAKKFHNLLTDLPPAERSDSLTISPTSKDDAGAHEGETSSAKSAAPAQSSLITT